MCARAGSTRRLRHNVPVRSGGPMRSANHAGVLRRSRPLGLLGASMSIAVETARVALLGCGTLGRASAPLPQPPPPATHPLHITAVLVRDTSRPRPTELPPLTEDARLILQSEPDVLVELLGGTEPARSLVLEALHKRIPVVTANKTLLAHHGAELRQAAQRTGTPLLYEAAVIAGGPFLGTFSRRPRAANVTSLTGIVNGTSNFVLTRCNRDNVSIDE